MRKFEDGYTTGTVDVDPSDRRVVLEFSYGDVLETRVTWSPDYAEQYAKAVLDAVQEARR